MIYIAADRHIIRASYKLGLITKKQKEDSKAQDFVIQAWAEVLKNSKYRPIDLQTPLWLWSRNDFKALQSFDDFDIENKIKNSYESNKYLDKFRNRSLTKFEYYMFEKVSIGLPLEANILDLGCGDGYPYDDFFLKRGYKLTGIDFCEKFIKSAKRHYPSGDYKCINIMDFDFKKKYDLVIALYSILHIPRKNHRQLFEKIYAQLKPKGKFLITLRNEDSGEIKYKDNFCGEGMFWSYYSYDKYLAMLADIGFSLAFSADEKDYGSTEQQNWVVLTK